jgi:hypothetical protein
MDRKKEIDDNYRLLIFTIECQEKRLTVGKIGDE